MGFNYMDTDIEIFKKKQKNRKSLIELCYFYNEKCLLRSKYRRNSSYINL